MKTLVDLTSADLPELHENVLLRALQATRAHQRRVSDILEEFFGAEGAMAEPECPTCVVPAWLLGGSHEQLSTVTLAELETELIRRKRDIS